MTISCENTMLFCMIYIRALLLTLPLAASEDKFVHCKMKPGCTAHTQCDPKPDGWGGAEGKIENHLFNKEFPITCQTNEYEELKNEVNALREGLRRAESRIVELSKHRLTSADINCDFDAFGDQYCGYTNVGEVQWQAQYLQQSRSSYPGYVLKFEAQSGSLSIASLKSPDIPSSRSLCLQFYYKINKDLIFNNDVQVKLNGRRIAGIAPSGVNLPISRWVGYQVSLIPLDDEDMISFEIIGKGSSDVLIDDIQITRGECVSNCKPNDCLNGGKCVDEITKTYCSCTFHYMGGKCETEKIVCLPPQNVLNGKIEYSSLVNGSTVTYSCENGFRLKENDKRVCQADGKWSGKEPRCEESVSDDCEYRRDEVEEGRTCGKKCKKNADCKGKNKICLCDDLCGMSCFNPKSRCPPPTALPNGLIDFIGTVYGFKVFYSCNEGFELKGDAVRVCRSDEKWSGKAPKCVELGGCEYPPRISGGFANPGKSVFKVGDVVQYECRHGYRALGDRRSECLYDGTWSALDIICSKVNCGDPGQPLHGRATGDSFLFGSWVTYVCDKGYELSDSSKPKRYCSTSGRWSGKVPTCSKKHKTI